MGSDTGQTKGPSEIDKALSRLDDCVSTNRAYTDKLMQKISIVMPAEEPENIKADEAQNDPALSPLAKSILSQAAVIKSTNIRLNDALQRIEL